MKIIHKIAFLMIMSTQLSFAQSSENQKIIQLSKDKWQWMSDKNVETLSDLFDEKSVFVHMGGSWGNSKKLMSLKVAASGTKKQISMMFL